MTLPLYDRVNDVIRNLLLLALPFQLLVFGQYQLSGGLAAAAKSLLLIPLYFLTLFIRRPETPALRAGLVTVLLPVTGFLIGAGWTPRPPAEWLADLPFLMWVQPVFFFLFMVVAVSVSLYELFTRRIVITVGYLIVTVFTAVFLHFNAPGYPGLRSILFWIVLATLVLYLVHLQMNNFHRSMSRYVNSRAQPVHRIRRTVTRMLLVLISMLVLTSLLAPYGAGAARFLLGGLLAGIRWATSFIRPSDPEYDFDPMPGEPGPAPPASPLPPSEVGWLGKVVEFAAQLTMYLATAAVIALFLYFAIPFVTRFARRLRTPRTADDDVRIRLSRSPRDPDASSSHRESGTLRPRRGLGALPADRVRLLFVRAVEKSLRASRIRIRKSDTARSISERIAQQEHRDMDALTSLYERARYGPEDSVDDLDVRRARQILKDHPRR